MDTTTHRTPARRLRTSALGAALLAAVVAVGLAACTPAEADCSQDCIDMVYANQAGDQVTVAGTGQILAEVTLYADAGRTQVVGHMRSWSLAQYPGQPITKEYQALPLEHPTPVQLAPATTYWYKAKATGAGGTQRTETGSFKTWQRNLTVKVTTLNVFDDSDITGSGEMTFIMRANGGASSQIYQNLDLEHGFYRNDLAIERSYTGVGRQITVQVRGEDDDCEFSTCRAPAGNWGTGSNSDADWATATATFTAPGTGNTGSWTATAGADSGYGHVGFTVGGTWVVTYSR